MATTFKPPKSLAQCADLLYTTRQERLGLDRVSTELKGKEGTLREYIIDNLPKSSATGISGKVANVKIEEAEVFTVKDWDAFYGYIQANAKKNPGVWALLNRALNQATIKEMASAGAKVPGVEKIIVKTVSCTKVS